MFEAGCSSCLLGSGLVINVLALGKTYLGPELALKNDYPHFAEMERKILESLCSLMRSFFFFLDF